MIVLELYGEESHYLMNEVNDLVKHWILDDVIFQSH